MLCMFTLWADYLLYILLMLLDRVCLNPFLSALLALSCDEDYIFNYIEILAPLQENEPGKANATGPAFQVGYCGI
jgi:hypothetical protein